MGFCWGWLQKVKYTLARAQTPSQSVPTPPDMVRAGVFFNCLHSAFSSSLLRLMLPDSKHCHPSTYTQ